jgi:hypothetical protein
MFHGNMMLDLPQVKQILAGLDVSQAAAVAGKGALRSNSPNQFGDLAPAHDSGLLQFVEIRCAIPPVNATHARQGAESGARLFALLPRMVLSTNSRRSSICSGSKSCGDHSLPRLNSTPMK